MERCRSPHLRLQIQACEEGAGMALRRRPPLHPQIDATEDGTGVTRHRRRSCGTSAAAAGSPLEDDDLLREILLRLPPQPSSLPRASAVCKRWLGLATDAKFHRQFRIHHRKPPLLGVFERSKQGIVFTPVLDPPERIPPQRLYIGRNGSSRGFDLLDCHHGRVLVKDWPRKKLVVFDPITGQQHSMAVPQDFGLRFLHGAVLCADSDQGHVGCHSSPFKVVLVSVYTPCVACVYSSKTGLWGNLIYTEAPCEIFGKSAVLVGNCLYWQSMSDAIVEFDLEEHRLTVIEGPPGANDVLYKNRQIIQAEDGAVGFAILSYPHFRMWQRKVIGPGVDTWVAWKTIEMHSILGFSRQIDSPVAGIKDILGYDENSDVVFIYVEPNVYMVQLKSMQSKRLPETHHFSYYHSFTSFYTPGIAIDSGSNGGESLHNR